MKRPALVCKGFTLIELLIVIAVIGVLATAVLSAIDPVEQIKKARDTSLKSDAAEFLNAVERYYATYQTNPWTGTLAHVLLSTQTGTTGAVTTLINRGELKTQFGSRTSSMGKLQLSGAADGLATVCFPPDSKTFKAKARKNNDGTPAEACTGGSDYATGACYICVPE